MKKAFTFIFTAILVVFFLSPLQAQSWQWAKNCVGNGDGFSVSNDAAGNVFITGVFSGSLVAGNYTLYSNINAYNVYIIKYDPNGNVIWAQNSTGNYNLLPYPMCCKTDNNGNCFVTGYFANPAITFGTYTLTNTGQYEIFHVKYDPNGNLLWAKSSTGSGQDIAMSVSTDPNGNSFIAGMFTSSTIAFGSFSLTNSGGGNAFIAKYDPAGNLLWAGSSGGIGNSEAVSVSTDAAGNAIITGDFDNQPVFGTYSLTNTGYSDLFLVKYSASGNVLWAKTAIGSGVDYPKTVSTDINGNSYVVGSYGSPNLIFGSYTITNSGAQNLFTAKYDSNGNPLWARGAAGPSSALSASSYSNGVFLLAELSDSLNPVTIGNYTVYPPPGYTDPIFIAQYDMNGNVLYAEALASGGDDWCSVSVDKFCNAYISGDYQVNPFVIGSTSLNVPNGEAVFIAKLSFTSTSCQPDGISSQPLDNTKVTFFPNPGSGNFKLEIEDEINDSEIHFSDLFGREIYFQKVDKGINDLNLKYLTSGMYFYTLKQSNRIVKTGKILIE